MRDIAGFFRKKIFTPKIGKMDQKMGQKQGFFEYIENFCH